jgi:hypothetical protein
MTDAEIWSMSEQFVIESALRPEMSPAVREALQRSSGRSATISVS